MKAGVATSVTNTSVIDTDALCKDVLIIWAYVTKAFEGAKHLSPIIAVITAWSRNPNTRDGLSIFSVSQYPSMVLGLRLQAAMTPVIERKCRVLSASALIGILTKASWRRVWPSRIGS